MKQIAMAALAAGTAWNFAAAGAVRVWEEPLTLPTYAMGAPDRNPVFVERRSYQGADAPVYPYPMWDAVGDRKVDRTYRAVYLENEFVQICVLPEIGGRVFSGRDKTTGYDFLYRQHVIKPALIGMVGAWISGGIEWNIPHHHRASTFMPVDHAIAKNADGSATIRVGELELRHRMRWVVELTLRPGSSCVEETMRLVNRTPVANSFLHFANIAVHANPDYQVLFPPDTHWVTQHGKREFARWPVADSIYNGIDFRRGVDVSWWKNHPSPISMFCWGSQMDFVGGYDHGRAAGFVHVSDRHTSPGKKFFTWGAGEAGQMWDRALTDDDGPYIELMAGSYSDNQPDYSWIRPYQTKVADSFWYPVAKIGGVKNANRDAAVNLETTAAGTARIGVAATSAHRDLTIELSCPTGLLFRARPAAGPDRPYSAECPVPTGAGPLTLRVGTPRGELIAYTAAPPPPPGPAPEPVRPPEPPEKIAGVEEVYQAGLRLEQLHSAALDPEDYYREVLKRDPGHAAANLAMGVRAWQRAMPEEAERLLAASAARVTGSYVAPKDGEPLYHLGLVRRELGRDGEARDAFERAAWDPGWQSPARQQLAEMCCAAGDFAAAAVHLDRALEANASNVKALVLRAAVLRKLGRAKEGAEDLARAAALDPLDPWPAWERARAKRSASPKGADDPQAVLEPACDYAAAGMWDDAAAVLSSAAGKAAGDPMIGYHLAFALEKLGREKEAAAQYAAAAARPADGVFPFRRESIDVLRRARERAPSDGRAAYHLGNLYMLHGRRDAAVAQWEDARRIDPSSALVHRNLALAYARQGGGYPRAVASMEAAVERDPADPRFLLELDQLYEAAGAPVAQRLARFGKDPAVTAKRDDTVAREAALLVEAGRFEDALKRLSGRPFHVWEGAGRTAVHNSYAAAHIGLGNRLAAGGRHREALKEYEAALEYPVLLGTGRPLRGERLTETHYLLGRTYAALGDAAGAARHFAAAVETAPANLLSAPPSSADDAEMFYHAALALGAAGRKDDAVRVARGLVEAGRAQLSAHVPMFFFASFGYPQPGNVRFAQAHYAIGLGLLAGGDKAGALKSFDEALKLNPDHAGARQQRQ